MRRERGWRASLALTLNLLALALAVAAVSTSYWCEGTRKVAKPFCTGPPIRVKQPFCIRFNSSNVNDSRLVQYIFETGEEKFLLRKFHTGIFFSCEQAADMNGKSSIRPPFLSEQGRRGACPGQPVDRLAALAALAALAHAELSGSGGTPARCLKTFSSRGLPPFGWDVRGLPVWFWPPLVLQKLPVVLKRPSELHGDSNPCLSRLPRRL